MFKEVLLLCVAVPSVFAFFNNPSFPTVPPGTLLQCSSDDGFTPIVPLQYTRPGEAYRPSTSGYQFPREFDFIGFNPFIANLLNINMEYQRLNRPNFSDILYFPQRYDEAHDDRLQLEAICGGDVLANVFDGDSNRNEDQGTYMDIRTALNASWHEIFDAGIDPMSLPRATELDSGTAWRGEVIVFFGRMMNLLECRVAFTWADAGPEYFPRYFRQGFCYNRKCSIPDRDEFRCHADLSPQETSTLEASRWDCCWTYTQQAGYKFECGFRRVNIPIVCDCDCRCIDKAGI